jgi:CheY-like chemotaxis protein
MNQALLRPIRILLVEDSPSDARLTLTALNLAKVANEVSHVVDGVEAIEFLHRRGQYADASRPDLILLDLNMPRKDGREVLAEIKTDPELKVIPVVVMTTSEAEQDIRNSYQLHANCFISKPVNFERFMEVVRSIENFWLSIVLLPVSP